MLRSLAHACFVVADLDRSIRFYCEGLGMKLAFEFRNEQDKRTGAYLSCGGRTSWRCSPASRPRPTRRRPIATSAWRWTTSTPPWPRW